MNAAKGSKCTSDQLKIPGAHIQLWKEQGNGNQHVVSGCGEWVKGRSPANVATGDNKRKYNEGEDCRDLVKGNTNSTEIIQQKQQQPYLIYTKVVENA